MKLSIIIPVFNEIHTIAQILKKIEEVDLGTIQKEIIIVDDGSTDGTKEFLQKLDAGSSNEYIIVYHDTNYGKSKAIQTALTKVNGDYVIIQDADLEYDPEDYNNLLDHAISHNAKVVYGSRRLKKNNKRNGLIYFLGGQLITIITNILYGTHLTDEPTGYKLFKTNIIKNITLNSKGFEFCPEVTAKIAKQSIKIHEIPISYHPRASHQGKKLKWQDGVIAIWTLIKLRF